MVRSISKPTQWIVINYTILFSVALSTWSLWSLPLFHFRPYHIGANIEKGMEIPEGAKQPQFETTFILEKNGEQKEFTIDNYPDSTWKFINSKTIQTEQGYVPPIHDFSIEDTKNGKTSHRKFSITRDTPSLLDPAQPVHGRRFELWYHRPDLRICRRPRLPDSFCLTASTEKEIAKWQKHHGAEYPFYTTDATTLKTIDQE